MSGAAWGGRESKRLSDLVKQEYGYLCHLCLKDIDSEDDYSVDHVIPRSKGGLNDIENLRSSHKSCNYSRQDRSIELFRAARTDERSWFLKLEA